MARKRRLEVRVYFGLKNIFTQKTQIDTEKNIKYRLTNTYGFFNRPFKVFQRKKKMVAYACNSGVTINWCAGCNWWRISIGTFYLYIVLIAPIGGI